MTGLERKQTNTEDDICKKIATSYTYREEIPILRFLDHLKSLFCKSDLLFKRVLNV